MSGATRGPLCGAGPRPSAPGLALPHPGTALSPLLFPSIIRRSGGRARMCPVSTSGCKELNSYQLLERRKQELLFTEKSDASPPAAPSALPASIAWQQPRGCGFLSTCPAFFTRGCAQHPSTVPGVGAGEQGEGVPTLRQSHGGMLSPCRHLRAGPKSLKSHRGENHGRGRRAKRARPQLQLAQASPGCGTGLAWWYTLPCPPCIPWLGNPRRCRLLLLLVQLFCSPSSWRQLQHPQPQAPAGHDASKGTWRLGPAHHTSGRMGIPVIRGCTLLSLGCTFPSHQMLGG